MSILLSPVNLFGLAICSLCRIPVTVLGYTDIQQASKVASNYVKPDQDPIAGQPACVWTWA